MFNGFFVSQYICFNIGDLLYWYIQNLDMYVIPIDTEFGHPSMFFLKTYMCMRVRVCNPSFLYILSH